MTKILVVEAQPTGEFKKTHYESFKQRGYELFFLICSPKLADLYQPHVRIPTEHTVSAYVEEAKQWHESEKFDAVVTMEEFSVMTAAAIAAALDLPGINIDAAKTCRNKFLMRQAHESHGVPHPPFCFAEDLAAALKFGSEIGYPVIIKPTLGAGSEHIYRIDGPEQMQERFQEAKAGALGNSFSVVEPLIEDRGPNGILVEAFLDGSEHSLEAFVWDGEIFIGAIGDRLSPEGQTFDNDIYTMPSRLDQAEIEKIRLIVQKATKAQGITRGILHPEIRYHNGEPYLVEMAARAGGGPISHMTRRAYNYCAFQASFEVSLGLKPQINELAETGNVVVAIAMICNEGRVESITVPDDAKTHPRVIYFQVFRKPGDVNLRPPNGNDLLGQITASGSSVEEAYSLAESIFKKIQVTLGPAI